MKLDWSDLKKRPDWPELKKRLQVRSLLALTLEAERIVAAVVRSEAAPGLARPPLEIAVGANDVVSQPEKAAQSVALALTTAGWRERRCVVCVPPGWALCTGTDLPAIAEDDLRGLLEIRAEQEFSLPAGDLQLGYCAYTLPDGQPRATLAVISGKRLKAIETFAAALGRRLVSVSLALADVLADPQPTLHFQTNAGQTDVIVTGGGGAIAALRSLPSPAATSATAAPVEDGEAPFDPGAFCREVRITLGRLPAAIRKQIVQAQFGGNPAAAQRLYEEIRDPLERMGIAGVAAPARSAEDPGAAADAARRNLRGQRVPFEFIVPEVRRWQPALARLNTRRYRWIGAAAAGLFLLPLLLFFIRAEYESHLETEWNAMQANVTELSAMQQKIRHFRPWFDPVPETVQAVESLIAAFPEQGDVWAKSVQIGPGFHVTCTGFARSQIALQPMLDHLRARPGITGLQVQQLRGDKQNVQFSISYLWQPPHEG